jgi:hypothetical protein
MAVGYGTRCNFTTGGSGRVHFVTGLTGGVKPANRLPRKRQRLFFLSQPEGYASGKILQI